MHARSDLPSKRSGRAEGRGEGFVLATVVRTVSVTAAKAGAKAIIRPDGTHRRRDGSAAAAPAARS